MEVPKSLPGSGMSEHRLQTGKDKTLQETMKLSGWFNTQVPKSLE